MKSVTFIGAGNVAWHLAWLLQYKGYDVFQVYSRNTESARALAGRIGAFTVDELSDLSKETDLVFLAVPDHAIPEILPSLQFPNSVIVHISGALPLDVLNNVGRAQGVFYPLQSFHKLRSVHWEEVPVFIEGSTIEVAYQLYELADNIGVQPQLLDSSGRLKIHLAGVLANNFTNYLIGRAFELAEEAEVSPEVLFPLIEETLARLRDVHPLDAQTGPARRNDLNTIREHLKLLENSPILKDIYEKITDALIRIYHGNSLS